MSKGDVHPGLAILREYIPDDNLRRDFISTVLHKPENVAVTAYHGGYRELFWAGGQDSYSNRQLLEIADHLVLIEKFIRTL